MAKRKPAQRKKGRKVNPNLPRVLALLGKVVELTFLMEPIKEENLKTITFPTRGQRVRYLCTNSKGDTLYILGSGQKPKAAPAEMIEANKKGIVGCESIFAEWQNEFSSKVETLEIDEIPLWYTGKMEFIVYESTKWKTTDQYIHNFENKTHLYISSSTAPDPPGGPALMKIKGQRLRVTERGIEG